MPYVDKDRIKPWKALYNKEHYLLNKERKQVTDKQRRAKMAILHDLAKAHPCTDCGSRYPACVMDWDHVNDEKTKNVSEFKTSAPSRMFAEIAKCELVCANCHRVRTTDRRNGWL